jgi:hypothetical protein
MRWLLRPIFGPGPVAELREIERQRQADNLDRLQAILDHLRAQNIADRAEYIAHYGYDPDEADA